jgi:hypothetical protein
MRARGDLFDDAFCFITCDSFVGGRRIFALPHVGVVAAVFRRPPRFARFVADSGAVL